MDASNALFFALSARLDVGNPSVKQTHFFILFCTSLFVYLARQTTAMDQHAKLQTHIHTSADKSWHFCVQFVRAQRFSFYPGKTRRSTVGATICGICARHIWKCVCVAAVNWNVSKECFWASCIYMFRVAAATHEMSFLCRQDSKKILSWHKNSMSVYFCKTRF